MFNILLIKIFLSNTLFYNVYYHIALFPRISNIRREIIHYRYKEDLLYILLIEYEKFVRNTTKKNILRA